MTKVETESLLRYMLSMYPSAKMSEQQFGNTVQMWASEFENDTKEVVGEAFRIARAESPDWMPSIPRIQNAIRMIASRVKAKSRTQEFMDTHCGKTQEEWEKTTEWENSPDGASKIQAYKARIAKLIGESA